MAASFFHPLQFSGDWLFYRNDDFPAEGTPSLPVELKDDYFDLNTLLPGEKGSLRRGFLVNFIDVEADGFTQMGFGTDWWFRCHVNGVPVYDTIDAGGNGVTPPGKGDHVFNLPLKKGRNTIVFQLLSGTSSWGVALGEVPFVNIEETTPELRNGPLLLNPGEGALTIFFITRGAMPAAVEYRKKGMAEFQRKWDLRGSLARSRDYHRIPLDGLEPGAAYEYRIVLFDPAGRKEVTAEGLYEFTAPGKALPEASFFVVGDTQVQRTLREEYMESFFAVPEVSRADYFAHVGDVADVINDCESAFFDGMLSLWSRVRHGGGGFLFARGNHDCLGKERERVLDFFEAGDGTTWQAFRQGPLFVLVLDCGAGWKYIPCSKVPALIFEEEYLDRQREWLKTVLASEACREAAFRVVLAHDSPFCDLGAQLLLPRVRDLFLGEDPVCRLHLWLAGHKHIYRRTIPGSSAYWATQPPRNDFPGGGDARFPILSQDAPAPGNDFFTGSLVSATAERLTVKTYRPGTLIDHIEIAPDGSVRECYRHPELLAGYVIPESR